jgi:hypothetical protein
MSQLMLYKAASLKVSINIISTNWEETSNLVLGRTKYDFYFLPSSIENTTVTEP